MFYKLFGLCLLFLSPSALAKYQVCSITINSSDEIEAFKKFLPDSDFDFIELLPSHINKAQDHSSHWFDSACKRDISCDILVVSGHFGGIFFGKSGYSLPTELLEEKACQNSCKGILSSVKEIFLFGCNTLASKAKDRRTYTEYLQVLLDDGMAREEAERVVAYRYSPLGTPFHDRMNFVFSGSETIYGFDELSPLGPDIKNPLEKYFQAINRKFGGYANYLKTEKYKRLENKELFHELPPSIFSLNQSRISLSNEKIEEQEFFNNKCLLYNDEQDFDKRAKAFKDLFQSGKSGRAFFAIERFLNRNKKEMIEGQGRKIFRSIRASSTFSSQFLSYYEHLNFLPYIRLVYLNVLEMLRWINPFDLHILRRENLIDLIKNPGLEAYISVLLLLKENQIEAGQFYISKQDLPVKYVQNLWGLLIFEKLKVIGSEWQEDILKYCEDKLQKKPVICHQALNTLAHLEPLPEIAKKSSEFLSSSDDSLVYYAVRLIGQSELEDYETHRKVADLLISNDPLLSKEALEALAFLKSPYEDIQEDIAKLLPQADEALIEDIFWSFSQMDIKSPTAQEKIIQYIIQNPIPQALRGKVILAFQNTSQFYDFSLSFFYQLLESKEDEDLLLATLEMLSKNKKMRDLGIHHRFLLFQQEPSARLKKEVLKKLEALIWLHPEIQILFLDYIRDPDPQVRRLVLNILKNIENLQSSALDYIETLYNEGFLELKELLPDT